MKSKKTLDTTTDNRTYKLCNRAVEDLCCIKCINRYRRGDYHIRTFKNKTWKKIPSWKLVSKNKKQYEKKGLKYKNLKTFLFSYEYIEITW